MAHRELIPYQNEPIVADASCSDSRDQEGAEAACSGLEESVCVVVAQDLCDNISVVAFTLDMNTDDPELKCFESLDGSVECDGVSFGVDFAAVGASIEGVAAP